MKKWARSKGEVSRSVHVPTGHWIHIMLYYTSYGKLRFTSRPFLIYSELQKVAEKAGPSSLVLCAPWGCFPNSNIDRIEWSCRAKGKSKTQSIRFVSFHSKQFFSLFNQFLSSLLELSHHPAHNFYMLFAFAANFIPSTFWLTLIYLNLLRDALSHGFHRLRFIATDDEKKTETISWTIFKIRHERIFFIPTSSFKFMSV